MNKKRLEYLIHVAIWAVMFIWPLMFMNHGTGVSTVQMVFISVSQLLLMVVFYTNYLWLAPKHFACGDKRVFWMVNAAMILIIGLGWHYWMELSRHLFEQSPAPPVPSTFHNIVFTLRDMFNLVISAAIATTVRLAMQWQKAEDARRQAELKTLRSQINPHFLLNTLNNIYALTAFNTQRAQQAIQELSKLLRHVLYDSEDAFTQIGEEVEFLQHYINLMRIRLAGNVEVTFQTDIPTPCGAKIAPLIFISLVENAFKHGVSPTQPSFIHIYIAVNDNKIVCDIENSNFPKNSSDKSGHGIGLKQVGSRLSLLYPGKYEWKKGTNDEKTIYTSKITIYDTKLRNNR